MGSRSLEMIDEAGRRTEVSDLAEHPPTDAEGRMTQRYTVSLPLDSSVHPGMKAQIVEKSTGKTICQFRVADIGTKFAGGQVLVVTGEKL